MSVTPYESINEDVPTEYYKIPNFAVIVNPFTQRLHHW